jgi:hypothetical protein
MIMARGSHSTAFKQQFANRLSELVETHLAASFGDIAQAMGYANSSTVLKAARAQGCLDMERLALLAEITTPQGKSPNLHWLITGHGLPMLARARGHEHGVALDTLRKDVVERVRQLDRERVEAMLALLGSATEHS